MFVTDPRGSGSGSAVNKFSDPETGWSYHGARWLAPEVAQWHSPDPPATAPDPKFMLQPWGLNPYQYVDQNPVVYWDPDGRDVQVITPSGAAIVAAGARLAAQLSRVGLPGRIAGGIVMVGVLAAAAAYENTRRGAICYGASDCTEYGGVPYDLSEAYEKQQAAAYHGRLALIRARAEAAAQEKKETTVLLHRGVPSWHARYDDATLGNAYPRGGNATPEEHNRGDTQSEYTSWTTTWSIAELAALRSPDDTYRLGGTGVVLTARIPRSRLVKSPDRQEEDEVLVTGAVTGAHVRYVGQDIAGY